ncbi:hypothetical protein [Kitasatospora purpeofusca]|uniref:hypothetical protein n=1 Tax=Kitasatospora purpeofusca TaxID=67352 RepID=UPI003825072D
MTPPEGPAAEHLAAALGFPPGYAVRRTTPAAHPHEEGDHSGLLRLGNEVAPPAPRRMDSHPGEAA